MIIQQPRPFSCHLKPQEIVGKRGVTTGGRKQEMKEDVQRKQEPTKQKRVISNCRDDVHWKQENVGRVKRDHKKAKVIS